MLWGYDVSQYQPGFDHHRARREGFEFCGLRAVGSENNPDTSFHRHLDQARAAGMIVLGGYLFVNDKFSAAAQAETWMRHTPLDCPLIIDSEPTPWSGSVGKSLEIVDRVRQRGYSVSLVYMGANMWNQLGRPDIRGLGTGLWKPHYPDNNGGYASQIYQRVPQNYWSGHGGFGSTAVLQFSQAATIAGNTPTDADAFLGTREQLLALVGGNGADEMTPEEDDALFDVLFELSGSRTVGDWPGWTNLANGHRHTLLDTIRWADWEMVQLLGEEAGQDAALRGLIDALDDGLDTAGLVQQVQESARSAVESAVVDVRVNVDQGDDETPVA